VQTRFVAERREEGGGRRGRSLRMDNELRRICLDRGPRRLFTEYVTQVHTCHHRGHLCRTNVIVSIAPNSKFAIRTGFPRAHHRSEVGGSCVLLAAADDGDSSSAALPCRARERLPPNVAVCSLEREV
jgi:hypothetical protein